MTAQSGAVTPPPRRRRTPLGLRAGTVAALSLMAACAAVDERPAEPTPVVQLEIREVPQHDDPRADAMYALLVGELAGQRGDLNLSVRHYLIAARLSDDPRVAERATRIAFYAEERDAAAEAVGRWVELAPDNPEAHQAMAVHYLRVGDIDAAVDALTNVVERAHGGSIQGFAVVTGILDAEGDQAQALEALERLADRYPDNPHAHYAITRAAMQTGRYDRAASAIDRVLSLRPDWTQARVLSARIHLQAGDADRAVEVLQGLVADNPDDAELRLTYARTLVEAGDLETAREEFERVADKRPDDPDVLYGRALLALEMRDYNRAEPLFERLLELGHRTGEARYYKGYIAEVTGDTDQALSHYEQVGEGALHVRSKIRQAIIIGQDGRLLDARDRLARIRDDYPGEAVQSYLAEAEVLRDAGEYDAAMTLLNGAMEDHEGNVDLLYTRALIAERLDDLDRTERDLRRILRDEPDHAHALNALGYTLADRTDRHKEAYEYISRALDLRPHDPAVMDSMGWVQYRLGNHDEALRYLRRALDVTHDAEIAAHLGEVLWVTGQRDEAREVWQRALDKDPEHPVLNETVERFLN